MSNWERFFDRYIAPVCIACGVVGLFFGLMLLRSASAGEAGTAETTEIGSVHEHAVGEAETPNDHPSNPQGRR